MAALYLQARVNVPDVAEKQIYQGLSSKVILKMVFQ